MPNQPLLFIVSAETDDVASAVLVAMYKLLLIARKDQRLFAGLLSVSKSCGAEEVPIVNLPKTGVVDVPTPTYVPLSKIEESLNANVVAFQRGIKLPVKLLMVVLPSLPLKFVQSP